MASKLETATLLRIKASFTVESYWKLLWISRKVVGQNTLARTRNHLLLKYKVSLNS